MEQDNTQNTQPAEVTPEQPPSPEQNVATETVQNPEATGIGAFLKSTPNRVLFAYGAIALAIIGVIAATMFNLLNVTNEEKDDIVSEEEKSEILSEIVRNNTKSILKDAAAIETNSIENNDNPTTTVQRPPKSANVQVDNTNPNTNPSVPAPSIGEDGPVGELDPTELVAPDPEQYNYRETQITKTIGSSYGECTTLDYLVSPNQLEFTSTEFYDTDKSYYKSESIDADGDLYWANISRYSPTESDVYRYANGTARAHLQFEPNPEFSNQYMLEYEGGNGNTTVPISGTDGEETIAIDGYYFGSDPKVVDKVTEGTKEYYIIEDRREVNCAYNPYKNAPDVVYIVSYKVDVENFQVKSVSHYINNTDESSLITKVTTDVQTQKTTLDEVSALFDPATFGSEEIVVDYASYDGDGETHSEESKQYVIDQGVDLLTANGESEKVTFVYGKDFPTRVANEDFYLQRNYYADTTKGEERYEEVIETRRLRAEYSYGFEDTGVYYYAQMYNKNEVTELEVLEKLYADNSTFLLGQDSSTTNVNGTNVSTIVRAYSVRPLQVGSYGGGASYPGSYVYEQFGYPASYPGGESIIHYQIFESGEFIFVVQAHNYYVDSSSYQSVDVSAIEAVNFWGNGPHCGVGYY